jgi:hypothetical protein
MRESEIERDRKLEVLRARHEAELKKQQDMNKQIMKSKMEFQEQLIENLKVCTERNQREKEEQRLKHEEEEKRRQEEVIRNKTF